MRASAYSVSWPSPSKPSLRALGPNPGALVYCRAYSQPKAET